MRFTRGKHLVRRGELSTFDISSPTTTARPGFLERRGYVPRHTYPARAAAGDIRPATDRPSTLAGALAVA